MRKWVTSCWPFWPPMINEDEDGHSPWRRWIRILSRKRRASALSWINAISIHTAFCTPDVYKNLHVSLFSLFTKHHATFHHMGILSLVLFSARPHAVWHSNAVFNCLFSLSLPRQYVWFESLPGLRDSLATAQVACSTVGLYTAGIQLRRWRRTLILSGCCPMGSPLFSNEQQKAICRDT